jgi:uncharacterized protein (TIGR00297 family)
MSLLAQLIPVVPEGMWTAAVVTLAFTALARWMRGVSTSGAWAGAVVCFLIYVGGGWRAFCPLVAVFLLTWVATRIGYERKRKRGTAERGDGRGASQVLANLGVAGFSAALYAAYKSETVLLVAMVAALSEAAADTLSSEVGQALSDQSRLITTWELVPAGTDGGITLAGTIAGIVGAGLIALVAAATGLLGSGLLGSGLFAWRWLWIPTACAVAGMLLDSVLGAWLERRQVLNNDAVNFLCTLFAAGLAVMLSKMLFVR